MRCSVSSSRLLTTAEKFILRLRAGSAAARRQASDERGRTRTSYSRTPLGPGRPPPPTRFGWPNGPNSRGAWPALPNAPPRRRPGLRRDAQPIRTKARTLHVATDRGAASAFIPTSQVTSRRGADCSIHVKTSLHPERTATRRPGWILREVAKDRLAFMHMLQIDWHCSDRHFFSLLDFDEKSRSLKGP